MGMMNFGIIYFATESHRVVHNTVEVVSKWSHSKGFKYMFRTVGSFMPYIRTDRKNYRCNFRAVRSQRSIDIDQNNAYLISDVSVIL